MRDLLNLRPVLALLVAVTALSLGGCAGKLVPLSPATIIKSEPTFVDATPRHEAGSQDATDMMSLISETKRIVTSPEFDANLRLVEHPIAITPFGKRESADVILTFYLGKDPAYTYVPTGVRWVDRGGNSNRVDGSGSLISLTRGVQTNWKSNEARRKSLAINSMAHELAHSLSHRPDQLVYVFTDRYFSLYLLHQSDAIASYTIGTVAQCTWLAEQEPALVMQECFGRYGLRNFKSRP